MNRIVLPCIYLWIASALAIFNSRTGTTMTSPFGHLRKYAAIGLWAYAASWSTPAAAQSPPTTVAYSIAAVFNSDYPASDAQWRGPVFTTGTVPTHITEITFGLTNTAPTAQATPRLFQLDDSNLSANSDTTAQRGSLPGFSLLAHGKYALIFSSTSGSAISLFAHGVLALRSLAPPMGLRRMCTLV